MSWNYRDTLQGLGDWQFSEEIASPIIRVRSTLTVPTLFYKGLIARARFDANGNPQFFGIRRIWSQPTTQIVDFDLSEDSLENSTVAFKVTRGVENHWTIDIDGWNSPMINRIIADVSQEDLVDSKITIDHGLGSDYVNITVYDNSRTIINPYSIRVIDEDSIEINFDGLTPLVGIYKVLIRL